MLVEEAAMHQLEEMGPVDYVVADEREQQISQLKELADLKAQGILTEEEFAAQKAQILGS